MLDKNTILSELENVQDENSLQEFYTKYLDKKGSITAQYKELGSLSPEERKEKGQLLTDIKSAVEALYSQKERFFKTQKINETLDKEMIDVTIDGVNQKIGFYTLIGRVRREAEEIFKSMGFVIEYGHDMVSKYENFISVNIPLTHPATEMHDTFYIEEKDATGENLVMRTHTSSMQNYYIKKYGVPLNIVVPGRCYRYENMDAGHDTAFWQLEGMVIGKNISIANFRSLISKFVSAVFKSDVKLRTRPGFFPFVEPGFEIDACCVVCNGKGCSLCKNSGWIEIIPGGMIHPNVLKEAGVNTDEYTGFAFGMGLTRIAAIKYGIKDIRLITNGDLRFVESFK